jgi:hypothetical protein
VQRSVWTLAGASREECVRAGAVYKYDISLPTAKMYHLVEVMRERLRHEPVR